MQRSRFIGAFVALAWLASAGTMFAQGFAPGQIVVWRVGGDASYNPGASALTSAATAVFLDQFSPFTAGQIAPAYTTSLPTTPGSLAQTDSGTATSNGFFSPAQNSFSLDTPGYNAAVGTAAVAGSDPALINRSIGVVSFNGSVNSSTGFNNGPLNNYRSVAGDGANNFWVSTAGSGTASGIMYVSNSNFGSVSSAVDVLSGNVRNLRIFNNSLFVSSGSTTGPGAGISLVGTVGALPTSATTSTKLNGTEASGTGTPSSYGFWLFDNPLNGNNWNGTGFDTLYIADDRSVANGGGLQRWVYDGAAWNLTGTITFVDGTSATGGFRGLAASIDTTGQPTVSLWLTTVSSQTGGGGNQLVTIADTLNASSGTFGSFSSLATAPTNTAFRGLDFTPVPEPSTILLVGMGFAGMAYGTFSKKRRKTRTA